MMGIASLAIEGLREENPLILPLQWRVHCPSTRSKYRRTLVGTPHVRNHVHPGGILRSMTGSENSLLPLWPRHTWSVCPSGDSPRSIRRAGARFSFFGEHKNGCIHAESPNVRIRHIFSDLVPGGPWCNAASVTTLCVSIGYPLSLDLLPRVSGGARLRERWWFPRLLVLYTAYHGPRGGWRV